MTTDQLDDAGASASPRLSFGPKPTIGVGAAGKAVAEDISALVKAEIALAKAELSSGMKDKAVGAGAFGAAGVCAWLGLQGLLITAGFALALILPAWAAALIVSALLLLVAAIAGLVGKRKMASPVSLDTTKENVEKDVAWTKSHLPKR
jgi:uncharacterized membrane protein YqjE